MDHVEIRSSFDQRRAKLALVLGPLVFVILLVAPLPLPPAAQRLAAVMALAVIFWIGEPVPLWVTAITAPTAALVLGAVPGDALASRLAATYSKFFDPIIWLFVGGFLLARAMHKHGLDRRLAASLLSVRLFNASPARVVFGLGCAACFLSMWVSNTATTAMMIPLALGLLKTLERGQKPSAKLAASAMLILPFAATVGGLATPIGTAPNLIGLAQLAKAGTPVNFFRWMTLALPFTVAMMGALAWLLLRHLPTSSGAVAEFSARERAELGPWSQGERLSLLAFLLAVGLWLATGLAQTLGSSEVTAELAKYPLEGLIALTAAGLLFIVPLGSKQKTLVWRDALRLDWGTLLLLGGGLTLGNLMLETGLAKAIARSVVGVSGGATAGVLVVVAAGLAIALSEITSNTATAAMLIPLVLGLTGEAQISPLAPVLAATFGCSFGFMLPISTPPNALAYGTGLVPLPFMVKRGIVLDLVGWLAISLAFGIIYPWLGLV